MTNRQKFTEVFDCEIVRRDTGEPVPGHCKILIAESEHFDEWLQKEYKPSAQPGWIPCKTALPKDDTEVIVSCTDDSGDYEYSYVTTGWHYKGLWVVNNDRCYFVRAWQPLPAKPWEGGQDGQN